MIIHQLLPPIIGRCTAGNNCRKQLLVCRVYLDTLYVKFVQSKRTKIFDLIAFKLSIR